MAEQANLLVTFQLEVPDSCVDVLRLVGPEGVQLAVALPRSPRVEEQNGIAGPVQEEGIFEDVPAGLPIAAGQDDRLVGGAGDEPASQGQSFSRGKGNILVGEAAVGRRPRCLAARLVEDLFIERGVDLAVEPQIA